MEMIMVHQSEDNNVGKKNVCETVVNEIWK